jgi:hypothetical protein
MPALYLTLCAVRSICPCWSLINTKLTLGSMDNVLIYISAFNPDFSLSYSLAWKLIAANWTITGIGALWPLLTQTTHVGVVLRPSKLYCFLPFYSREGWTPMLFLGVFAGNLKRLEIVTGRMNYTGIYLD